MKKLVSKDIQSVNPAIVELVKMGEGFGSTRLSGKTHEETKKNFRRAMSAAKERLNFDATT
ncbi:hypothetical protein [Acinetobacter colistiniresistens]|uniref:hypothetical protein n=1 Tax=Acinetobacter colistiniresistens TaxID=280145 RepID=UPI0012503A3B|nr:hypothetical protein [Acinetobacter colistiniresistens]